MLKTERRKLLLFYFYTEQEEIKFTNEYTRFLSCPLIRLLSFTRRHLLYMECMWSLSLSSLTLCSIPFSFKQILFQMTLATCLFFLLSIIYLFCIVPNWIRRKAGRKRELSEMAISIELVTFLVYFPHSNWYWCIAYVQLTYTKIYNLFAIVYADMLFFASVSFLRFYLAKIDVGKMWKPLSTIVMCTHIFNYITGLYTCSCHFNFEDAFDHCKSYLLMSHLHSKESQMRLNRPGKQKASVGVDGAWGSEGGQGRDGG